MAKKKNPDEVIAKANYRIKMALRAGRLLEPEEMVEIATLAGEAMDILQKRQKEVAAKANLRVCG
ncbi:MAG: hypothetical protein HN348_36355 [Proteobacteria bacterium]|jgi:hypothetical protein|nr:hypothetical protein [Pseudomonadota bacterium]